MSKITELKYKSQKNAGKVILEEAIKRLQSAIELKDQGKCTIVKRVDTFFKEKYLRTVA